MHRRRFIQTAALGATVFPQTAFHTPAGPSFTFSITGNRIDYFGNGFARETRMLFLSDTHLWQSDPREEPYREFSRRMAGAYHQTKHFQTGEALDPMTAFEQTLAHAVEKSADLLVLGGDIFSYPSEAAIEWAIDKLKACGIPYLYTTGNHDWHYEGMPGSSTALRREWIGKRLTGLYGGRDPYMQHQDINGIRFLAIDDSNYEIMPEQFAYFERHTDDGVPVVLLMHIPLYAPGRPVNFGCGHPEWGAASDRIFEVERRERWPEKGHTPTTMEFHRRVFGSKNVIGIVAGHTHQQSLDVVSGIPQFVAPPNAHGGFLEFGFTSI